MVSLGKPRKAEVRRTEPDGGEALGLVVNPGDEITVFATGQVE